MVKIATVSLALLLWCELLSCARSIDRKLVNEAAYGRAESVKGLIAEGANIEVRALDDWTALTVAAKNGHYEVVKILLENGADVNAKEGGGHTALFWAERGKHEEVAELLRKAGGVSE